MWRKILALLASWATVTAKTAHSVRADCSPWGREESDTTERLHFHFSLSCIGEGNGNPLQCSCLENPRNGGAWWPAIYGVAQGQTQLKWLSSSSSSSINVKINLKIIKDYVIVMSPSSFSRWFWLSESFRDGSVVKNLPVNSGDTGLIPGSGIAPGGGNGNPVQYSYLENPMDRGAW